MFSPVARSWQAYRSDSLVYFRHFKCASSSYLTLFQDTLHWKQICITEIYWDNDHVFSYIRDPYEKRISGLAEYVCRIYKEENVHDYNHHKFLELINHPYFPRIIARAFIIDDHSLPIYNILGTNAELVDWIPIDVDAIDHGYLTLKLLNLHGIDIDPAIMKNISRNNVSTGYKKEFMNQIKNNPVPNLVVSDLDYDNILYSHVLDFIDPEKNTWKEISWLKVRDTMTREIDVIRAQEGW
jgi:hypothetical protein